MTGAVLNLHGLRLLRAMDDMRSGGPGVFVLVDRDWQVFKREAERVGMPLQHYDGNPVVGCSVERSCFLRFDLTVHALDVS